MMSPTVDAHATGEAPEHTSEPGSVLEARPEVEGESVSRVGMSQAALDLITTLEQVHGPLMFHQSGGCCDGSSPMCFPDGDFKTGGSDILLGTFELPSGNGLPFWMSREQFEYWKHTHLTLDVVDGRGSGFSVEAPEGKRFLIRSRLMDVG
ncbi:DUF779 domain-containing protein [Citricoccus nitrophenolicus]|uniref:DUF779 domain-containing protein n=1 Tax=Citricoccus nitrophenolicus TaxID=863575 RepID=UPI0039B677E1